MSTTETPNKTKAKAPPIDFGAAVIEDAPRKQSAAGVDLTIPRQQLEQSFKLREAGEPSGIGMTIPESDVGRVKSAYRAAGDELGYGVAFEVITADSDKGRAKGLTPGMVRLVAGAKPRKQVQRKTAPAAAQPKPAEMPKPGAKVAK